MQHDARTILSAAIAAGNEIVAMLDGMDEVAFIKDRRTQRATERLFEIIGEALARLSREFPEVASRIPECRRVIDFRNVLAHGYDVVDPRTVFDLAQRRLPALLQSLQAVVG